MVPESGTDLRHLLPAVTRVWRGLLRAGEDLAPRTGARGAHDDMLATTMIRAALAPSGSHLATGELDALGRAYGSLPRRRCFDPRALYRELGMLRHAAWVALRDCFAPGAERVEFLKALDRTSLAIHRAIVASQPATPASPPAAPERRRSREVWI